MVWSSENSHDKTLYRKQFAPPRPIRAGGPPREASANPNGSVGGLCRVGPDLAGTGEFWRQENQPASRQSHRTTTRGLRELYPLGFIDDTGPAVRILPLGRQVADLATQPINEESRRSWHNAFWDLRNENSDGTSHPYRVLLRLVERKPGISRAKCALALEAKNDSVDELNWISALADRCAIMLARLDDSQELLELA